jgi:hypothetical protein
MKSLLPDTWSIPQRFRDRLGQQAGKPRAMAEGGHLLLILHEVPKSDTQPGQDPRARFFWRAPDGAWQVGGSSAVGVHPIKRLVGEYRESAEALEQRLDTADQADEYFAVLRASTPLLRAARALHRALQEAREASNDDKDVITLRDQAGEIERLVELIHADAQNGLEFTAAKRAEEQAELSRKIFASHHRLNMLAATFLPLTAIAAALGMDPRHAFGEHATPFVVWAIVIGSIALGLGLRKKLSG